MSKVFPDDILCSLHVPHLFCSSKTILSRLEVFPLRKNLLIYRCGRLPTSRKLIMQSLRQELSLLRHLARPLLFLASSVPLWAWIVTQQTPTTSRPSEKPLSVSFAMHMPWDSPCSMYVTKEKTVESIRFPRIVKEKAHEGMKAISAASDSGNGCRRAGSFCNLPFHIMHTRW